MRERLESLGIKDWVERFDPAQYNRNATLAENLLFGTPVGRTFDVENLPGNAYVRHVLRATGLDELLLRTGHKVAETMVELFSGLPPGHEFFAQYSFINQDDLPQFEAILKRVADVGSKGLNAEESRSLLALPLKLIAARHRLGLIDESFEARVIEARRYFAENLPPELRAAVEFFDPERYNSAATLQDNILFGKIVTGQAGAVERITKLVRELLDELELRPMVMRNGLDFQVGVGGARLAPAERQKVAMMRALLKRPVLLVLDQAAAVVDPASQTRVVEAVLRERQGAAVIWVLTREEYAPRFCDGAGDGARTAGGEGRVRRAEKENRMSLEQEVELIRQFPIFAKIQPAMQKLLCFSSERLTYAPGQVMFKAGDMGDAAFIVIEGEVQISVPSPSGPIVVNTLGKNDIIGEIAIFGDVPRTATATAQTKLETLKISKELFEKIIRENPDAALELIRVLAGRLANTTAQLSRTMSGTRS